MAAKKTAAKPEGRSGGKQPKKRAPTATESSPPASDDLEARLSTLSSVASAVREEMVGDEQISHDPEAVLRSPPIDEEAAEAIAEDPEYSLSEAVFRALRATAKEDRIVRVFPTMVVGTGPYGTIYAPWNAPEVRTHLVDGAKLYRALRAIGSTARLIPRGDDGLEVVGEGHRFGLSPIPGPCADPIPLPQGVAWGTARPAAFRQAAVFAGDDKIEPPHLAGVCVDGERAIATDRRAGIVVAAFAGGNGAKFVLPRGAFDGIDDDAVHFYYASETGHACIGVPSTGEYRVLRSLAQQFPDMQKVLDTYPPSFELGLNKKEIQDAVRKMAVVQSRLSSVKLNVFTTDAGSFVELRGGDASVSEYVARLPARHIAGQQPPMFKLLVAGDLLLRFTKVALGEEVRLSFGADEKSPVTMHEGSYRALALVMVA